MLFVFEVFDEKLQNKNFKPRMLILYNKYLHVIQQYVL